ncbi:DUF1194 domain-containing protein [Phyllobacterium myrsinacearum]|uniref:DUF1194 domain-containing protein n=1 Tax=Phyllobacterium myrsinacearum TaxID=28101 RepID=A0A839EQ58_9HYPH|nr:DUF1194 domain-containing protein [Phyllobacterium myrsinacearum]MBA8878607.1 hypothetical protein [Phyllobacterium myrsinacearum]
MASQQKASGGFLLLAASLASSIACAQPSPVDVDVELVLAVDASRSMEPFEQKIQRDGYIAALRHKEVIDAIREGVHGRVAITYVEWAGAGVQRIIVPWTLVDGVESAERLASALDQPIPSTQSRTSISGAIDFGATLFDNNAFRSSRHVIDISGDGANNHGRPVVEAREEAIAKGVTINGLPLMTQSDFYSDWAVSDLDAYYGNCVIGGRGAFMVPVTSWEQFPEAVRRKLVQELAGDPGIIRHAEWSPRAKLPVVLAQAKKDYDCLSGERIWQRRMQDWETR